MSATPQIRAERPAQSATRTETPPKTALARAENPLTPSVGRRLDAETIRAALSVLPTAVEDGEE